MRALPLVLILLSAAPARGITLSFSAASSTPITIACGFLGGPGPSAADPPIPAPSNPADGPLLITPGVPWSVSGSFCDFDYSFSISIDSNSITLSRTIVDHDPESRLQQGIVRGWMQVEVFADEDFEVWDGISYDPNCSQSPCAEIWLPATGSQGFVASLDVLFLRHTDAVQPETLSRTWYFTPEPGTAALVAVGLAATASVQRRSSRDSRGTSARRPATASDT